MTQRKLPKAYLRIDPNIDQTHPDNLDGFIRLLCAANRQPVRGTFRSRAVLEALLGKANVAKLAARNDISIAANGIVAVPGWEGWQEGDLTVAERMQRLRDGRNTGVTSPSLDEPDTVTAPSPQRSTPSKAEDVKTVDVLSIERTTPPPPAKRGRRKDGTNPRAEGTNLRSEGENPRANGESPRQVREAQKRGPTLIGDILRRAAAAGSEG